MIIQSDFSIFVETNDPLYEEQRDFLASIAHLEKSPEHLHTYKITALSLWTAAALNIQISYIIKTLNQYSKFPVPQNVQYYITSYYEKYGRVTLCDYDEKYYLLKMSTEDKNLIRKHKKLVVFLDVELEEGFLILRMNRGTVKILMIQMDNPLPVKDMASFQQGAPLPIINNIGNWAPRAYQEEAVNIFQKTGYGVVVLPCGAGKTIVGIEVIKKEQTHTLIVVPHYASLIQWKKELLSKTDISEDMIGEYSGNKKELKPITLATYQVLVYFSEKDGYRHLNLFLKQPWGLIIYDEVHMLPAPVFKITTEIQTIRRLGLTATLVREDGKEKEIFALIGPKKYDVPWKDLEAKQFIAHGVCVECRISLNKHEKITYYNATKRERPRIAGDSPVKDDVVEELLKKHQGQKILVIGQYIQQLERLAHRFDLPLITGKVSNKQREKFYQDFKLGIINVLVLSKVANLALDLPDATIAIQVSGSYGSRQEEAQRLGRILRPKEATAYFYSIISKDTVDEDFSQSRQLFLVEQGYQYLVEDWD